MILTWHSGMRVVLILLCSFCTVYAVYTNDMKSMLDFVLPTHVMRVTFIFNLEERLMGCAR